MHILIYNTHVTFWRWKAKRLLRDGLFSTTDDAHHCCVQGGGGAGAKAVEEGYRRTPSPTRLGRSGSLRGNKQDPAPAVPASSSPKKQDEESDNGEGGA